MKFVLNERALEDLQNIYLWISQERPRTAKSVRRLLFSAIEQLAMFPKMGRVGGIPGTREWVVPRLPYTIVYRLDDVHDVLRIIAVFHEARSR